MLQRGLAGQKPAPASLPARLEEPARAGGPLLLAQLLAGAFSRGAPSFAKGHGEGPSPVASAEHERPWRGRGTCAGHLGVFRQGEGNVFSAAELVLYGKHWQPLTAGLGALGLPLCCKV